MSVLGVDPGLGGALAHYDHATGALTVTDMPTWYMQVGAKKRQRIDAVELLDFMEAQKMMGVELVLIESVGGRPKQSASAGFVFGYTVGLLYMACIAARIPIETVSPQVWKRVLNIPGKARRKRGDPDATKAEKTVAKINADGSIIGRADELFPNFRSEWRGPKGGYYLDRAEAALLAYYAARYQLNSTRVTNIKADTEWSLAYRNADTGT